MLPEVWHNMLCLFLHGITIYLQNGEYSDPDVPEAGTRVLLPRPRSGAHGRAGRHHAHPGSGPRPPSSMCTLPDLYGF